MKVLAIRNDTFANMGMRYTIGGSGYGVAIARNNGYEGAIPLAGQWIDIPDEWLKPIWAGVVSVDPSKPGMDIVVSGGGGRGVDTPSSWPSGGIDTQVKTDWGKVALWGGGALLVVLLMGGK
jgi:hypothetical protein